MTEKKQQLSFDEEIYPPMQDAAHSPLPDKKAKPRTSSNTTALPGVQPFLPGLSRRGRPRSKNPIPASVRAIESRKKRMREGLKRVELLLPPDVAAQLELLVKHFHVPRAEIISRLIAKAAKKIPPA